jgi:hypothetical protein
VVDIEHLVVHTFNAVIILSSTACSYAMIRPSCLLKYLQLRQLTICTPADETDASETRVDAVVYNYSLNIVQRRQSYCDTCQICRVFGVYSYLIVDASAMFTAESQSFT